MPASDDRVRQLIAQEAADWFVANQEGIEQSEWPRFALWLRTSPMHVEEYLAVASIAQQLPGARSAQAPSIESLLERAHADEEVAARRIGPAGMQNWRRQGIGGWLRAATVAVGVLAVAASLALWIMQRPMAQVAKVTAPLIMHTERGQLMERQLADHSVIRLDTDSGVMVRYSVDSRVVQLTAGRANFEVAHEPKRGFQVLAGAAAVHAVGTNFDVRLDEGATLVTVYQGLVRVTRAGAQALPQDDPTTGAVLVGAGRQLRVEAGSWPAIPVLADTSRADAWMHGQIRFRNEPIERVAMEFNRYSRLQIRILTPELRKMEISGSFSAADVDAFVLFLRGLQGVRVSVSEGEIRVTRP